MATNDVLPPILSNAACDDSASIAKSMEENSEFCTSTNATTTAMSSEGDYSEDYVNIDLCYDQMDSTMLVRDTPINEVVNIESEHHQQQLVPTEENWEFLNNDSLSDNHQIESDILQSTKSNTSSRSICSYQTAKRRDSLSSLILSNKKNFTPSIFLKSRTNDLLTKFSRKKMTQSSNIDQSEFYVLDRREIPSDELINHSISTSLTDDSVLIENDIALETMDDELFQRSIEVSQIRGISHQTKYAALDEKRWKRAVAHLECYVEADEEILGVWLLSEIDHWDCESERIVFILTSSILSVRYDFFKHKVIAIRIIGFSGLYSITYGPFDKPFRALLKPKRAGIGVCLRWNKDLEVTKAQQLNPFSKKIPYITFGPHPSTYNTVQSTIEGRLSINHFLVRLREAMTNYMKMENGSGMTALKIEDVCCLQTKFNKFGIVQQLHNKAQFGCNKI